MKFLLTVFLLCSIHVLAINRLRTLNSVHFDDPQIVEKTQEIWTKLSTPSLEKGYATSIKTIFNEVKALVAAEIQKKKAPEKDNLEREWQEFLGQYNSAAESFDNIRESMRKIELEKAAQTNENDVDTQTKAIQKEIANLVEKVAVIAKVDQAKLLKNATIRALAASMPPSFCWKKPDFGTRPKECPAKYPDRSGELCYRNCEQIKGEHGYTKDKAKYKFKLWGGVCWENCEAFDGTTNQWESKGLVCNKKNEKGWHWKRSFVTSSKTNFDTEVKCPTDMYKGLALCYRDCKAIGYENCGIGACSIYKSTCHKEVARMAWKSFTGVLKFVGFVLSGGATSAVTEALKSIADVVGQIDIGVKIFEGFEIAKTVFRNVELTKLIKDGCIAKTTKYLSAYKNIAENDIIKACNDTIVEEINRQAKPETKLDITTVFFDTVEKAATGQTYNVVSGALGIINACDWKKKEESSFKTNCARAIFDGFSAEPTGLVGLVAAFIYEKCPKDL